MYDRFTQPCEQTDSRETANPADDNVPPVGAGGPIMPPFGFEEKMFHEKYSHTVQALNLNQPKWNAESVVRMTRSVNALTPLS
jgi:hypothetical protein